MYVSLPLLQVPLFLCLSDPSDIDYNRGYVGLVYRRSVLPDAPRQGECATRTLLPRYLYGEAEWAAQAARERARAIHRRAIVDAPGGAGPRARPHARCGEAGVGAQDAQD